MEKRDEILRGLMAIVVGIACTLLAITAAYRFDGDVVAFYTGSAIVRTGRVAQLYDARFMLQEERRFAPALEAVVPANRPAFYYAAIAPLSLLPLNIAGVVWLAVQVAVLTACWVWGLQRFGHRAVLASYLYPPAVLGIAHGQDCLLYLAILIAAYSLALRKRSFTSGLVLGMLIVKPHLIAVWPIVLVARRQWRMLAGFACTAFAAAGAFVAVAGVAGIRDWIVLVGDRSITAQNPPVYRMINVTAIFAAVGVPVMAAYAVSVLLVIAVVLAVRNAELWALFSVAILTSLIVAPRVLLYDYAMALLPLWLAAFEGGSQTLRRRAFVLASPFLLTLVCIRPWWSVIPSVAVLAFLILLLKPMLTSTPAPRQPRLRSTGQALSAGA